MRDPAREEQGRVSHIPRIEAAGGKEVRVWSSAITTMTKPRKRSIVFDPCPTRRRGPGDPRCRRFQGHHRGRPGRWAPPQAAGHCLSLPLTLSPHHSEAANLARECFGLMSSATVRVSDVRGELHQSKRPRSTHCRRRKIGLRPPLTTMMRSRCSSHPIGSGRSSLSSITRWSAHPPRIASTKSGASSASRRIRLT